MARPFKAGLTYFPLDVSILEDDKVQQLTFLRGLLAEIVYIRILTMVFNNGYYLETSIDSLAKTLTIRMGTKWMKVEKVRMMIQACLEAGLFDKELAEQGVITSISIQKQYILSTKRRRNLDINKYWLLNDYDMTNLKNMMYSSGEEVIASNNNVIESNSTQREKENKKDKKDKTDKSIFGIPNMHFLTKSIIENKYINMYDLELNKYNQLFKELVDAYGFDMVQTVTRYIINYAKHPSVPIDDRFGFFKTSIINNINDYLRRNERKEEDFEEYLKRVLQSMD